MTDTPPNLEDGELWLPSDVFEEIISSNNIRTNSSSNLHNYAPSKSSHVPNVQPLQSWEPMLKSLFKSKSSRPKYYQGNKSEYESPAASAPASVRARAAPAPAPTPGPARAAPAPGAGGVGAAPLGYLQPPNRALVGAGGLGAAPLGYKQPPNPILVAPFRYFQNTNFHNNNRTPMLQQPHSPPFPFPSIWWHKLHGMMTYNMGTIRRRGTGVFIPLSRADTVALRGMNTRPNAGEMGVATPTYDKTPGGKINQGSQKSNVTKTNSAKKKGKTPA